MEAVKRNQFCPYFYQMKATFIILFSFIFLPLSSFAQQAEDDKELLSRAIDYFNDSKYHEAALIFRTLSAKYKLNSRFKAYHAVCEFHEWNYSKSAEIFDKIADELTVYSPNERNVYYYTAAESHFNLGNYPKAISYYEMALSVCHNNEKAENYYKQGICHLLLTDTISAKASLTEALTHYNTYPTNRKTDKARTAQIQKMLKGLKKE